MLLLEAPMEELGNSQILRSSFGPLDLVGRNFSTYCGSLIVRANIGALVPPLGALFLRLSIFAAILRAWGYVNVGVAGIVDDLMVVDAQIMHD